MCTHTYNLPDCLLKETAKDLKTCWLNILVLGKFTKLSEFQFLQLCKRKIYTCILLRRLAIPQISGASQLALLVKNPHANAGDRRRRFNPWVGKIPWRRVRQPTPAFLPGEPPWTEKSGRLWSIVFTESDWSNLTHTLHDAEMSCHHACLPGLVCHSPIPLFP